MASSQEIVLVGGDVAAVTLYDDMSMNGWNGPVSYIVDKPGDRGEPTTEMPKRAFYMHAPLFD